MCIFFSNNNFIKSFYAYKLCFLEDNVMGIDFNRTKLAIDELTKNIEGTSVSENSVYLYYFDRAILYFSLGEYELALDDISVSLYLSPNDPMVHAQKGIILHASGRNEEAILEYERALEIDPTSKYVKENRNLLLSQTSNKSELFSLSNLSNMIKTNPNDFSLYYKRGCLYDDVFDYNKAKDDLSRCIDLSPSYFPAYNARGVVLCKLRKYEDAVKDFDIAIILDSHYEDAYTNKINLYKTLYDNKKRLETIDKLIEKNPEIVTGYYEKALYYKELKDIKEAIIWIKKAIDISPEFKRLFGELKELTELLINEESNE